jgi:GNAT superfamily N-acetyltransferase
MLTIKQCTVQDLEGSPNFADLLAEYAIESSIAGLPAPNAKLDMYRSLEQSGAITLFGALVNDELVGFLVVLAPMLPHYGRTVATAESFFVAPDHRSSGAGLELLRRAEKHADEIGSPALLVSAPAGGVLEKVLPRVGYQQSNTVFFKRLGHG